MINNNLRSLSIRAKTKCKLLTLDRETLTRILGSIEEHLAKDYDNEFQQRLQRMQDRRNNSQTFDKNFIELKDILNADNMSSLTNPNRIFNNGPEAVRFDAGSALGSIGN